MSGDTATFGGTHAEVLVAALSELGERSSFVLVGGLAVAARLRTMHRATQDLDAVVDVDPNVFRAQILEGITDDANSPTSTHIKGVKIDIIDVDNDVTFDQIGDDVDDLDDRLFNAAHLHAFRSATPVQITAGSTTTTVDVATAGALLLGKLHAYHTRREPLKHGSDAMDVWRLADQLVRDSPKAYAETHPVAKKAGREAMARIAAHPQTMVRRLRSVSVPATDAQVEAMAELVVQDLLGP